MADEAFRCLFEQDDGSFCWEAVAAAGQRCARHTRVVEVPVVEVPPAIAPVGARAELPDEQRCVAIQANGQRCTHRRKGRTTLCGTHKNWTPLVQCAARVGRGDRRHQCRNNARPGLTMCGIHKAQEPEAPAVPAPAPAPAPAVPCCHVLISSRKSRNYGMECGLTRNLFEIPAGPGAQPEFTCATHVAKRKRELVRIWRALDLESVRAVMPANAPVNDDIVRRVHFVMSWRVPMTVYSTTDPALARQESRRRADVALDIWADELLRRPVAVMVPQGLARFTNDRQNVHTREANAIVAEANKDLEKTEAITGSLNQIKARFVERNFGTEVLRKSVYKDMKKWYTDPQVMAAVGVMQANDFGYQRLLDKVWGLIQASRHKDDLEQRLWEEAVDSLGMCTQGHMTRLANVLQGFEEASEAPKVEIPKGERLQTAMAQIAELPLGEREAAARRVFAELEIPEERQGSWLEALEVA